MSDETAGNQLIARLLDGTAPVQLKLAAARGALPLPRTTLVQLYVILRQDSDETVKLEAQQSLDALDRESIAEVLDDESCAAAVHEHFAPMAARDEMLAERIAYHSGASVKAVATLASVGTAAVLELVLTNQERLLKVPMLLDLLSVNPALRPDQRGRILELLDRSTRAATAAAAARAEGGGAVAGDVEVSEELLEAASLLNIDIGELYSASEILGGEEFLESDDPGIRSAYQKILSLNVAQKAVLAMRGGREERLILIRDTNKLVALGVLRNPRVNDDDIEGIARMRNVAQDVLRTIGQNREWTKNYSVMVALINNPRTPQGISTNFVPRLQTQDLRKLSRSKDVPELIRRMSQRTIETRLQKLSGLKLKK